MTATLAPTECQGHGLIDPLGQWYVERCLHVGDRYVVDIRYNGDFFAAHVDFVERPAATEQLEVEATENASLEEAQETWERLTANLLRGGAL